MEPVVGLDVSKGTSVMQAFLRRNEPYGKPESIPHDESGYTRMGELLAELQSCTAVEPVLVLEATGHYHRELVEHCVRQGWKHYIVNPLQSKRAKGSQLRKVKTDATDAWHLAQMYYRGDVNPHRTWDVAYTELQHVTRQYEFITGMLVQAKLNARALLEQVFPAYTKLFGDVFSLTSLQVLKSCLSGHLEGIEEVFKEGVGKARSKRWMSEKKEWLQHMLEHENKPFKSEAQTRALEGVVSLLIEFSKQLGNLEKQIERFSKVLPEVELMKSIPGIGNKLAAAIVAEIGDARQFQDAKQLVAYAGLDPSLYSSGKFTATTNRITNRGSKRLRRALYLAVQCGLRRSVNCRIKDFYEKKRKEGKPYKVAVIACANKLLHHVYAILSKGQPYQA